MSVWDFMLDRFRDTSAVNVCMGLQKLSGAASGYNGEVRQALSCSQIIAITVITMHGGSVSQAWYCRKGGQFHALQFSGAMTSSVVAEEELKSQVT